MDHRAMRTLLTAGAVAALVAFGDGCDAGSGGGPGGPGMTTAAEAAARARLIASGKQVYADHCSTCHRLLGRRRVVDPPPDAYGPSFDEVVVPESHVIERVTNGFGGMQSFSGELTARQIRAVAAYVVAVGGRDVRAQRPPAPTQLAAGKAVFAARCARCHALLGRPASDPPRWPPTDFDVVHPSARFVASLLGGSGNRFLRSFMARLRGRLDRREIRDVAAYVSSVAGDRKEDGRGRP